MKEIKRLDALDLEHYVNYLNENGLIPKNNLFKSSQDLKKKNIAGINITEIPAISDMNITLKEV
jgi:hypothetical protein